MGNNMLTKAKIRKTIKVLESYPYTFLSNRAAGDALKSIEKEKGKLPREIIQQCNNYAKNYLGNIKYAPWLYVYSAVHGQFKEGWIPDNYYRDFIVQKLDGLYSTPCELKPLSNRILNTNKLPDLLYINNGTFILPNDYAILPNEKVLDYLFNNNEKVIFKNNDSSRGRGVKLYNKENLDFNELNNMNGVFQRIIKQHEFFDNIFPHPGATIRITTALDDHGIPTVRAAYLRLGRITDDSQHVQSKSAVKVSIDITNGSLAKIAYMADWTTTQFHPDTNVSFEGLTIPGFKKARDEIESLHKNYPFVQSIGWDVSINEHEELEIMEWNAGHNDIKFSEAVNGPCFKDLLLRTLLR